MNDLDMFKCEIEIFQMNICRCVFFILPEHSCDELYVKDNVM